MTVKESLNNGRIISGSNWFHICAMISEKNSNKVVEKNVIFVYSPLKIQHWSNAHLLHFSSHKNIVGIGFQFRMNVFPTETLFSHILTSKVRKQGMARPWNTPLMSMPLSTSPGFVLKSLQLESLILPECSSVKPGIHYDPVSPHLESEGNHGSLYSVTLF